MATEQPLPRRAAPRVTVTGHWQPGPDTPVPSRPQRAPGWTRGARRRGPKPRRPVITAAAAGLAAGLAAGIILAPRAAPAAPAPLRPPALAACDRASPVPCWGQDPLHRAYGTGGLYARGITGTGTTIAVLMPDAGPWAAADLAAFDAHYRLPAARLQVLRYHHARPGTPGAWRDGWEEEGAVDLELAHYMAPGARLIFVATPDPGPRQFLRGLRAATAALGWLTGRQPVDVAVFCYGTYEATITARGGAATLAGLRAGIITAAGRGVSVIAGSGDSGPTGPDGTGGWYPRPTVAWPTSDPLVTGVGATTVPVPGGPPPVVLTDPVRGFAGGGGLSVLFPRPAWQDPDAAIAGNHRAVIDIAMTGLAWVYFARPGGGGWQEGEGTSAAAPLLAGITADAAQLAGHPLGPLNPALYQLRGTADGITDVTEGSNADHGLPGYPAGPGYDLPTGIGTIGSAARFAAALARLIPGTPGRPG